ncbi:hypothetical protein Tco_1344813 [Tanacetum coccineum]
MVACLERIDGKAELHQIANLFTYSLIHYALTVSPTIYASYIEQFWATAKSKTVNDVKQIHATVDGKTVERMTKWLGLPLAYRQSRKVVTSIRPDPWQHLMNHLLGELVQTASKKSHDPPLLEVNTSGSGEDNTVHQDDLTNFVPPTPYDSPLTGGEDVKEKCFKNVINNSDDDNDDNVNKAMRMFEGETVNAGGAVMTATTEYSAFIATVTTYAGVSISTAEPRTPPTTTTTAF